MRETDQIKNLAEDYFKDNRNFIKAKISHSVVELEFQTIDENYHETLIPFIKKNVGFMINFKYMDSHRLWIFS